MSVGENTSHGEGPERHNRIFKEDNNMTINWEERLIEIAENADFIGHNDDILVRLYRNYNESIRECGYSLRAICRRLNGQFVDDRGNCGLSLYIPRESLTDDTYERLMNIEF